MNIFNPFKKKCPVCKMVLDSKRKYPEEKDKTFCSESCKENYRRGSDKERLNHLEKTSH